MKAVLARREYPAVFVAFSSNVQPPRTGSGEIESEPHQAWM